MNYSRYFPTHLAAVVPASEDLRVDQQFPWRISTLFHKFWGVGRAVNNGAESGIPCFGDDVTGGIPKADDR